MGWGHGCFSFAPYKSVAERRKEAEREIQKAAASGKAYSPVTIDGRKIAASFWGKGWCDHLEKYSDYSNRLPRGRSYVRNGQVIDLQVKPGKVLAKVMGSSLYHITIRIEPLQAKQWSALKNRCAGQIGSVLELLKGGFSTGVMSIMTDREAGMFPASREISMDCSCPDGAMLCKHLAAVLYGIGARLDREPELLFVLRQVDPAELAAQATSGLGKAAPDSRKGGLKAGELSEVFGIDIVTDQTSSHEDAPVPSVSPRRTTGQKKARKRAPARKRGRKRKSMPGAKGRQAR